MFRLTDEERPDAVGQMMTLRSLHEITMEVKTTDMWLTEPMTN
jgi:hypothetical protein